MTEKSKIDYLLWFLSVLMLIPCYISITGIQVFFDSKNPVNYEGLEVVAYMVLYSTILWLPYFLVLLVFRKKVNRKAAALSSLPFVFIFGVAVWLFSY